LSEKETETTLSFLKGFYLSDIMVTQARLVTMWIVLKY